MELSPRWGGTNGTRVERHYNRKNNLVFGGTSYKLNIVVVVFREQVVLFIVLQ